MNIKELEGKSLDIEAREKEKLKSVFPQCFNEGKLDIDKLLNLCGEYIDEGFEKYKFEWKGKSECYRIAGKRSTGTLRPCPEESVDFDKTNNLYIEGDNLEVLKILQIAYYRKVKMIYIDPPYNTGNDFVYEDDFKDPLAKYKEVTSQTTKSNPETMGRYHTNWLNMMYPRLRLAANLLRDDGVIFISIDDNEVTNLRRLCDEVFGEENFVAMGQWRRVEGKPGKSKYIGRTSEFVLIYAKNKDHFIVGMLPLSEEGLKEFRYSDGKGKFRRGQIFYPNRGIYNYEVTSPYGNKICGDFTISEEKFKEYDKNSYIYWAEQGDHTPYLKIYLEDFEGVTPTNTFGKEFGSSQGAVKEFKEIFNMEQMIFDNPKPTKLLKRLLLISNAKEDDIILDFFSGSATTAHAVMQLNAEDGGNRQFIMVQLPELCDEKSEAFKAGYKNICEIGKERIRRAGQKIKEQNADVDTGFKVFKLDSSNLTKWDNTPIEGDNISVLFSRMDSVIETIKKDRSELDIVYEVMLKLGIPLTYSVQDINVNNRKVYSVGDDGLILICLDGTNEGIQPEDITAMCELAPGKIIAAEEAFKDDIALSNAFYISKDKGIEIELL